MVQGGLHYQGLHFKEKMKKLSFLFFVILLTSFVSADATFNGSSTSYKIRANLGYVSVNDSSTNYKIEYSIVSQPIIDSSSSSYNLSMGFFQSSGTYIASSQTGGGSTVSGGSSSSSSSSAATGIFDVGTVYPNKESIVRNLGRTNKVTFTVNNEIHTVEVIEITMNTVTLRIASTPFEVEFAVGDSETFDMDGDGFKETKIELKELINRKAVLAFSALSKPEEPQEDIVTEEQKIEPVTQERTEEEKKFNYVILIIIMVLIIIEAVVIYRKEIAKKLKNLRK